MEDLSGAVVDFTDNRLSSLFHYEENGSTGRSRKLTRTQLTKILGTFGEDCTSLKKLSLKTQTQK